MFDRLSHVRGSSATAIYHYIGKTFGVSVETVVLLVRALWVLCFVSLCVALDAFVDLRLYSKEGLNRFIAQWNAERNLIELCTAGSKADTELGGDPNQSTPQRNRWAKLFFRISQSAEESVSNGETGEQGNHSYDRFRRKGGSGEGVSEALVRYD